MARYLMTHSLLSSWLYAMKENPYEDASTERDPYREETPSIIPTISDFLEWLDALELAPLYKEKWLAL